MKKAIESSTPMNKNVWARQAQQLQKRFEDASDEYRRESSGKNVEMVMVHCDLKYAELAQFQLNTAVHRMDRMVRTNEAAQDASGTFGYKAFEVSGKWKSRLFHSSLPPGSYILKQSKKLRDQLTKFPKILISLFNDGSSLLVNKPFTFPEGFPSVAEAKSDWLSILFEASWGPANNVGLNLPRWFAGGSLGSTAIPYVEGYKKPKKRSRQILSEVLTGLALDEFGGVQPECFFCVSSNVLGDSARLLDWLIELNSQAPKSSSRNKDKERKDEPTEADMILGRRAYDQMITINKTVAGFRDACRKTDFHRSNAVLGKVFRRLNEEQKQ